MRSKNINVLHVRSSIGFYGAEKVISLLLPALVNRGHKASLVCLESLLPSSSALSKFMMRLNIPTESYVSAKKYDLNVIANIKKYIIHNEFNMIHTHDYKSLFYIFFISKSLNIPVVHHKHGSLGNTLSEKVYALIENFLTLFVSSIAVVSNKQLKILSKYFLLRKKLVFIPNGVNIPDYNVNYVAPDVMKISMVARFTEEKNHLLALQSIKSLLSKHKNIMLNLYGDGLLLEEIKNNINELDLNRYVKIHGYQTDMNVIYSNTDLLLITSTTEGLPMTLLESMSYGIPVVSTKVGEVTNILTDSKCGFLTEPNPEQISFAMSHYIENPSEFIEAKKSAINYVSANYTTESQVSKLIDVYNGVIN